MYIATSDTSFKIQMENARNSSSDFLCSSPPPQFNSPLKCIKSFFFPLTQLATKTLYEGLKMQIRDKAKEERGEEEKYAFNEIKTHPGKGKPELKRKVTGQTIHG